MQGGLCSYESFINNIKWNTMAWMAYKGYECWNKSKINFIITGIYILVQILNLYDVYVTFIASLLEGLAF